MTHIPRRRGRSVLALACAVILVAMSAATVSAHEHRANGHVIANWQMHGTFDPTTGIVCGGDPAAYGLETAHHGPDSGIPGRADGDGCYQVDSWPPGSDDNNPAIN